jgi:hypothetical protein
MAFLETGISEGSAEHVRNTCLGREHSEGNICCSDGGFTLPTPESASESAPLVLVRSVSVRPSVKCVCGVSGPSHCLCL